MGKRIYKIKCKNCNKEFSGDSLGSLIADNNLKKEGKYYICDCRIEKKKSKKRSFSDF